MGPYLALFCLRFTSDDGDEPGDPPNGVFSAFRAKLRTLITRPDGRRPLRVVTPKPAVATGVLLDLGAPLGEPGEEEFSLTTRMFKPATGLLKTKKPAWGMGREPRPVGVAYTFGEAAAAFELSKMKEDDAESGDDASLYEYDDRL
jgi:hypothetical protein